MGGHDDHAYIIYWENDTKRNRNNINQCVCVSLASHKAQLNRSICLEFIVNESKNGLRKSFFSVLRSRHTIDRHTKAEKKNNTRALTNMKKTLNFYRRRRHRPCGGACVRACACVSLNRNSFCRPKCLNHRYVISYWVLFVYCLIVSMFSVVRTREKTSEWEGEYACGVYKCFLVLFHRSSRIVLAKCNLWPSWITFSCLCVFVHFIRFCF